MRHTDRLPNQAFTIVELLIAVVIIAVLATIAVISYNGATAKADFAAHITELSSVQRAIEAYRLDNGKYPDSGNCASEPNEYNYRNRWCGFDQGRDDAFVPGLVGPYMKNVPNLNKSLPDNDTYLYQSRAENGEDSGTAQYQLMRLRVQGINSAEKKNKDYVITGNGYDGIAWGIRSNGNTPWW